jgi:hypothetical protein
MATPNQEPSQEPTQEPSQEPSMATLNQDPLRSEDRKGVTSHTSQSVSIVATSIVVTNQPTVGDDLRQQWEDREYESILAGLRKCLESYSDRTYISRSCISQSIANRLTRDGLFVSHSNHGEVTISLYDIDVSTSIKPGEELDAIIDSLQKLANKMRTIDRPAL